MTVLMDYIHQWPIFRHGTNKYHLTCLPVGLDLELKLTNMDFT